MNENFNKNVKVEKFTNILGIAIRLIVMDPLNPVKIPVSSQNFTIFLFLYLFMCKSFNFKNTKTPF